MKKSIIAATGALFSWAALSFAQTSVEITTEVSPTLFDGAPAVSIKQYGAGNSGGAAGIRFVFDKVSSAAGGAYADWELKQVNLTFTFDTTTATLTIQNRDAANQHTFVNGDTASLEARFSGSYGTWSWGLPVASLLDGSGNIIATGSNFESSINAVLNDQVTLEPYGQAGDTYEVASELDAQRMGSVGAAYFSSYSGAGNWNFDVKNSYPVTFNIQANDNLNVSGSTPTTSFYTEVEYIMIPEPASAALLLLVAGGGLWIRRIRNRGMSAPAKA